MNINLISPNEKELLRKIESRNDSDVTLWRISNVIIPIITIIISLICFCLFKSPDSLTFVAVLNLLVNGSIPMIALNRIGGMGIYLFKYDRGKEKRYEMGDTYLLRTKLFFLFLFLVVGTIILYVYQVLNNPINLSFGIFLSIVFSVISFYSSINLSKKVYLLQDHLIDKTFEQDMRDDMKSKGHGNNWDNQ